ncbi:MAG: hypothetical protein PHG16_10495 [Lachnospiraceae bacterium]|nr:hypothetical protein [Lachnospiraceae bacterium]
MKKYVIVRIYEADFGCEERPEGMPLMDEVLLRDRDGDETIWKVEDALLIRNNLEEGDELMLDLASGSIEKILQKDIGMHPDSSSCIF